MNRQLWLSLSGLVIPMLLQAQGISFFEGTWEDAKAKAKAENKLLFVDAYASWCGPCKWMAANAFKDGSVGTHFNQYFVSVKMDMENPANVNFVYQYPVEAYPTLFFIKSDGTVAQKVVGAQDGAGLLAVGKEAQKKHGGTPINPNNNNNNNNNNNSTTTASKVYTYYRGSFETNDGITWKENAADGVFNFKKEREDENYIYIYDASRGVRLSMPHKSGQSFIEQNGTWVELYDLKMTVNGGSKPIINKTTKAYHYAYSGGSFESDDAKTWKEQQTGTAGYNFITERDDETYYYLLDKSRGTRVALPKDGGTSYIDQNGNWVELYELSKK